MSRELKINNPEGIYFLTWTVHDWVDAFTRMDYRDMVLDSLRYCQQHKGLQIYAWVIMSNHLHLIASAENGNLSDIIRDSKTHTSKKIINTIRKDTHTESRRAWLLHIFGRAGIHNPNNELFQFWKQDNHPVELSSNHFIEQKLDYIHNNPVTAGIVDYPHEYRYSSARDYAGTKGLLDIILIE